MYKTLESRFKAEEEFSAVSAAAELQSESQFCRKLEELDKSLELVCTASGRVEKSERCTERCSFTSQEKRDQSMQHLRP